MSNRTIGTEIKLTGEKEFNQQMKAINNGLKTTKSDMAALSSEFEDNANSMQALTQKQKLLQSSVDQHKAKVEALSNQYKAAADAYGENSAMAQKYKQQLNQATVALNKANAALDDNKKQLREARNPIKNAVDGYRSLVERLAEAQEKTEQFAEKQKKANELLARSVKPITSLSSLAGKTVGGVAKGVGAITAASAAGVAAIGAGGVIALTTMASMAREAAEAAKAAQEAGETLTASQQQWLAFSGQLDALDASVANAKGALAGVLLPILGDLSTEGAAFLNDFTNDMTAAAGNTERQGQVMAEYISRGAKLIKQKLPEYISVGKELITGLAEGLSGDGDQLYDMGIDLVMELLDGIIENAPELAQAGISLIQKLTESLIEKGPDLVDSAADMVSEIVSGLAQAAPSLIPAAAQLVGQLVIALAKNAPQILGAGLDLIMALITGALGAIGEIANAADEVIDTFVDQLLSSDSTILQMGGHIVAKIKQGIQDGWSDLVGWFNSLWDNLFSDRNINVGVSGDGGGVDGSHASGLDYVPFDGYLARLHRGETVLTADEASAYRRSKNGGGTTKQFSLTIHTQSLSKEELDMIVAYVNGKLGDDL